MDERTYLDAGGRAPLHPAADEAMAAARAEGWADPRRLHAEGRRARLLLESARQVLAHGLGCRTEELHLAPSHTAALHAGLLAIHGGRRRVGRRVVLSAVERAALHSAARWAVDRAPAGPGVPDATEDDVVLVGVDRLGRVDLEAWRTAVAAPGTGLAVLQHANGEVGTVQPLTEAYGASRSAGVPLLVDAGASVGHVEVPPSWDALVADPADWGGPTGVGVLAVRTGVRTRPAWPEDEDRWFPGGVDVPGAVGAAAALRAVLAERVAEDTRLRVLVAHLRERVAREVPDVEVVGDPDDRLPHVVTFSCLYVDGEALLGELDRHGFAVGSGSACTSAALEPSHVLAAMGVLTHGNVRLGLSRGTTTADVDRFCDVLPDAVARVRQALGAGGL